jgi:hypothetical protein
VKKRLYAIWSILLVLVVSFAVLGLGCPGGTTGTIYVEATLDGLPWTGAVEYTLTGPGAAAPTVINGHSVDDNFSGEAGSWNCTYVSGGPGVFVDITPPPPQTLAAGGNITFTLNFVTPQDVDVSVEFKTWTHNGAPVSSNWILVYPGDWIDVEYTEHASGEEDAVVDVHQTSWLSVHNIGLYGEEMGPPITLHVLNAPGAVKMSPPADLSNQQATVGGNPVYPCDEVDLPYCQVVNLDVEVDLELVVCNNYTKTINWIGFNPPGIQTLQLDSVVFETTDDMYNGLTLTLTSWACVEVGVGFNDINPDNDCTDPSPALNVTFILPP